ncbi:hypothetical protein C8F01DRAFT_1320748 [Mycena amicta]|nr:hypothetical protein C8F01DRAFT_1320748 [Mycena amicta]
MQNTAARTFLAVDGVGSLFTYWFQIEPPEVPLRAALRDVWPRIWAWAQFHDRFCESVDFGYSPADIYQSVVAAIHGLLYRLKLDQDVVETPHLYEYLGRAWATITAAPSSDERLTHLSGFGEVMSSANESYTGTSADRLQQLAVGAGGPRELARLCVSNLSLAYPTTTAPLTLFATAICGGVLSVILNSKPGDDVVFRHALYSLGVVSQLTIALQALLASAPDPKYSEWNLDDVDDTSSFVDLGVAAAWKDIIRLLRVHLDLLSEHNAERSSVLRGCYNPQCGRLHAKTDLKRCETCRLARYCSSACQKRDWKERHRTYCDESAAQDDLRQASDKEHIALELLRLFVGRGPDILPYVLFDYTDAYSVGCRVTVAAIEDNSELGENFVEDVDRARNSGGLIHLHFLPSLPEEPDRWEVFPFYTTGGGLYEGLRKIAANVVERDLDLNLEIYREEIRRVYTRRMGLGLGQSCVICLSPTVICLRIISASFQSILPHLLLSPFPRRLTSEIR